MHMLLKLTFLYISLTYLTTDPFRQKYLVQKESFFCNLELIIFLNTWQILFFLISQNQRFKMSNKL